MSRITKSKQLLEKSVNSAVSAIEIYNKPDFKYREEIFSILMINAWELLFKSKILEENNNKLETLYVKEKVKNSKGESTNKWKYTESRSGNKKTVNIFKAIDRLDTKGIKIDNSVKENINLLVEIRDNAIHLYNTDQQLCLTVQQLGMASLKSFVIYINEWFNYNLTKFNFYLMPLTFFHQYEVESFSMNSMSTQQQILLEYIKNVEKKNKNNSSEHAITLSIQTKLEKPLSIRITRDPKAPAMSITPEQLIERFKWDSKELWFSLKKRYKDIKQSKAYFKIKKELENDPQYCYKRPYNLKKPSNGAQCLFDPNIIQKFDEYYTRKKIITN